MITTAQVEAEQELASLCGVLNTSYARLVAIVAQSLKEESWAIAGIRSPEHWLMMRAGSPRSMPDRWWRWPGGVTTFRR
jgi:hypothetical protein